MRVVFFANTEWYLYNFRRSLARAVVEQGHEVVLLSPPGPYGERLRSLGFDWRPVPLARRTLNPLTELKAFIRLILLYRDIRPDLVHHFTLECIVLGSLAARLTGVGAMVNAIAGLGSIFTSRSWRARMLKVPVRTLLRIAFRRAEAIFQNPEDLEKMVRARVVEEHRAHLIRGSGVDTNRFQPQARQSRPDGRVLFASRLLRAKGIYDYIEAARLIRARLPEVRFLIAGEPDSGSSDEVPAVELERWRAERVAELLGHRDDMAALLRDVDLVVLPTYYGEGVPRILVEAAAAGIALIATDVPGCREIVVHEDNGLLVPPRNPTALASAIERLMLRPDERAQMGRRGRALAVEAFDQQLVIARTLLVYKSALGADP